MAHTKALRGAKKNKDSIAKRLGVKKYAGEKVKSGFVLIRQRGTKIRPGEGTYMGKDYTIHAAKEGEVYFKVLRSRVFVCVK